MVFILILPLKVSYHLQNDPGRICQKKLSKSLTTTVPRGLILSSSFARRTKEFGKTSLHRHVALSETGTLPTDCSNALHAVTPRIQLLCFNFLDPSYSFSVLAEPGAEETSRSASANKRAAPRTAPRAAICLRTEWRWAQLAGLGSSARLFLAGSSGLSPDGNG